jgi:iron complex transport system ATP-binding protein
VSAILRLERVAWEADGVPIVSDVSFEVAPGELVALMGLNGAGKSTVLDLMAGTRRPSSGRIELGGRPLDGWTARERARRIGHLPQIARGELVFSAEQIVLMGRYPHADRWFESDADRVAVDRAMTQCQCAAFRDRRVSTLSGGERQRVMLAACLAQQPDLLLLDEPSTFLDVDQQLHCFSLLREEAATGRACVAVTHDLNLALTFCSRVILLAGKTVAHDLSTADALAHPEWLSLFSPRLRVSTTDDGGRWVCYR